VWQTLVGTWPITPERLHAYVEKAVREAKTHTTWTSPDEAYEHAVHHFIDGVLRDEQITAQVEQWVASTEPAVRAVVLGQKLLQLVVPGVPDVYQGTELVDLSLVDPDNRRPVDFERRSALLGEIDDLASDDLLARWREGLPKLALLARLLRLRRERPALFLEGTYAPVAAEGPRADRVIAFERRRGRERALVVVPRHPAGLVDAAPDLPAFGGTDLLLPTGSTGARRDAVTGETVELRARVRVEALLGRFPVAVAVTAAR
jgi:(1->4)-alpha-D-glucan 1-alpha-D-glucosylmutase